MLAGRRTGRTGVFSWMQGSPSPAGAERHVELTASGHNRGNHGRARDSLWCRDPRIPKVRIEMPE
jgi:hypothetical protein